MKDVISLGIGEPDFDTPWHVRESTVFALERGATHYTSNFGYLELRRALARYVAKTFGAEYNPENEVLITVGVSEALDLALRALLNPGDEVLYHEPCYVSYRATILFAHGVPVEVETRAENGFRLTRAMLEAKVTPRTKVLMLNFPNNPTGAVMSRADLEDIAAFARERDLIVITDEIYGELTYDAPHTSIVSLPGLRDRTIFLHGFSKAWAMTGFRLGYACGPGRTHRGDDEDSPIHDAVRLVAEPEGRARSPGPAGDGRAPRWWTNTGGAGTSSPPPSRRWAWSATVRWGRSTRSRAWRSSGCRRRSSRSSCCARRRWRWFPARRSGLAARGLSAAPTPPAWRTSKKP